MDLKNVILNERSQTQKNVIPFMWSAKMAKNKSMLFEVRILVPFVGLVLERGSGGASGMLLKGEGSISWSGGLLPRPGQFVKMQQMVHTREPFLMYFIL